MFIILPIISVEIPAYALFATIGLICAVIFVYFRTDTIGISFSEYILCLFICAVCSLSLARLLFVVAMIPQIEITIENIAYYFVSGGIVFYGGMIGVLVGVVLFCKIRKKESILMLDSIAPAIPLFHFWGRIGCLFAGCCYGLPWSWGVIMRDSPDVIRFPVQFIEGVCCLGIFLALIIKEKKHGRKWNICIYLISYAICRFVLEYFRGDTVRGIWWGMLSTAQIVSVIIFIVCITVILVRRIGERGI